MVPTNAHSRLKLVYVHSELYMFWPTMWPLQGYKIQRLYTFTVKRTDNGAYKPYVFPCIISYRIRGLLEKYPTVFFYANT